MSRLRRVGRWIVERLKDLFYIAGNDHLDHGRVVAFIALCALIGGELHNIHLKQPIDLGPAGLGGGLTGVLGALVIYLFKDRQAA